MDVETVNTRMHIALKGEGTAKYDPRQAVVESLNSKKHRQRELNYGVHKKRNLFVNFFAKVVKNVGWQM